MTKKKSPKKEKPSTFVAPPPPEPRRYAERLYHVTYEYPLRGCISIDVKSTVPGMGPTEVSARLRAYDGYHSEFEVPNLVYIPEDAVTFVVGLPTGTALFSPNEFTVAAVRHWNRTWIHKIFDFASHIFD